MLLYFYHNDNFYNDICVWLLMLENNQLNSKWNPLVNTWQEFLSIICYHTEDWNSVLF